MKRLYHILSLMALVNLFALAGFVGFLFASGRLNAERMDQMAMVLRGEFPQPASPTTQPATQPAEPPPQPSRAEIARLQARREYYELLTERSRREMDQRRALNQQIRLDVTRQLEEIEARRREFLDQKKQLAQETGREGFEKELEVFSSLDPKRARDLLMVRKDPDVVQILMRMEPLRVKKIADACKTEDELAWIGRILTQIHNLDSVTANGVDGPNASSR